MTGNTDPSINAYPGRLAGKVALVTGGRSGLGFAIAMRLQKEGAAVVTAQRGEASGFESISADFTDPESPARVVDAVIKLAGRLDILVNNAGVMQEATAEGMKLEDWQTTLFVNLTAPSS